MKIQREWGTHLPVLIKLTSITNGSILELGGGVYSTPFLHWVCFPSKRKLVSYDSDPGYFQQVLQYVDTFHDVTFVNDWDSINIELPWDIVLVDHVTERRATEAKRVANFAKYVVLHDSDPSRNNRVYKYDEVYPLFKYRFDYKDTSPNTTVLSNFVNLTDFKI